MLHVFGGQGKRGVLDLSQFASQIFHFVSEDLEIKSNTPQVSEIQGNCFKIALFAKEQTNKKKCSSGKSSGKGANMYTMWYRMCSHVHAVWHEQNWRVWQCRDLLPGGQIWWRTQPLSFVCHTSVTFPTWIHMTKANATLWCDAVMRNLWWRWWRWHSLVQTSHRMKRRNLAEILHI